MSVDALWNLLSSLFQLPFSHNTPIQHVIRSSNRDENRSDSIDVPTACETVGGKGSQSLDPNAAYWWNSSGYAIGVLLSKAGYSFTSQVELLSFFRAITGSLGPPPKDGKTSWASFITDDHNPIELSWDSRTAGKPPKLRFAMEPVGPDAGTEIDPRNSFAYLDFRKKLPILVPGSNMAWLDHFQRQLSDSEETSEAVHGHPSKEFFGFDLGEDGSIFSKAYFFPAYKAKASGTSKLEVISAAIRSAPESTPAKVQALDVFQDFVTDDQRPPMEIEMLATDLIQPSESRFKIYFRIRDTSFSSFRDVVTLGGRIPDSPERRRGLVDLRQLYKALFVTSDLEKEWDEQTQLPVVDHRTGGLIYFAEFKYGNTCPKVKAYLPVRHYTSNEEVVFSALQGYLRGNESLANYVSAMRTIFSEDALKTRSGLQTYLGCSIEEGGELRLVVYINPRETKFAARV